ncbi:MAG: histone H1 [Planctomycetes bacterium]|nr:histone H1 [Planctomycetota bacterium]
MRPSRRDEPAANTSRRHAHMETYELLKRKVEEVAEDMAKAFGGNKAAGTRVRKAMQDIKAVCQDIRVKVLEVGKTPPTA